MTAHRMISIGVRGQNADLLQGRSIIARILPQARINFISMAAVGDWNGLARPDELLL